MIVATFLWELVLEKKQMKSGTRYRGELDAQLLASDMPGLFRASPMLPLSVLGNFDVLATSFAAFTSGMVIPVMFYFVAIFIVIVAGKSAEDAGAQLLFFAPGMVSNYYNLCVTCVHVLTYDEREVV